MKAQRNMFEKKEKDNQTKWDKQSIWQRVQSNSHKDAHQVWEKSDLSENFNRERKYEEPVGAEEHSNKWKTHQRESNSLDGINNRLKVAENRSVM